MSDKVKKNNADYVKAWRAKHRDQYNNYQRLYKVKRNAEYNRMKAELAELKKG